MSFSDYASITSIRPDKPLVVKCTFDQRMKRITFSSSRNCSYDLLRAKVEQCFALSATSFTIRYKDDDGEITDVASDGDLTEAIHYFSAGDDQFPSSGSSVISGRGAGGRKITLRLNVVVDYELSLSDTASLASLEEYDSKVNASDLTLAKEPLNGISQDLDFEDDAVTVSSRDTASIMQGAPALHQAHSHSRLRPLSPVLSDDTLSSTSHEFTSTEAYETVPELRKDKGKGKASGEQVLPTPHEIHQSTITGSADKELPDSFSLNGASTGVYDTLKRLENANMGDPYDMQEAKRLSQSERGVQWLKDQNVRAIQSMLGALPDPSVSDEMDSVMFEKSHFDENLAGGLALQRDQRGKYYYSYTSSSSGTSSLPQETASEFSHETTQSAISVENGASPHGLAWLAEQQHTQPSSSSLHSANRNPFTDPSSEQIREQFHIHPDIPAEVLKFIPDDRLPLLPPSEITNCSSCGVILDSFRYVCTTCGELEAHPRNMPPSALGKAAAEIPDDDAVFQYPPKALREVSSSPSSSSWSLLHSPNAPRRTMPSQGVTTKSTIGPPPASSSQDTLVIPDLNYYSKSITSGYELCSGCIESAGVVHAVDTGAGAGMTSSNDSPMSSPEENIRNLSELRRTAPRSKGHLRHAYREKIWSHNGWKDVEQAEISNCSICDSSLAKSRYKCASCAKFDLCYACYSQVHEIHPSHAFLSVPIQIKARHEAESEEIMAITPDINGDSPLKHPGVKCHHCMLDIVGARFHCAICDAVDICANCESAGLPGNLTSPDGGHDSSHIMIKIPYPLESTEVATASRHAVSLWHERDQPELQRPRIMRRRSSSQDSTQTRTVVGLNLSNESHARNGGIHRDDEDHYMTCSNCGDPLIGVRYQCATCPSAPASYNLCAKCEDQSFHIHNPRHIFIKIPRPLDRPIKTSYPLVPVTLYSVPAGIVAGRRTNMDSQAYLESLYHRTAICDRCVTHIRGVWLHCAYCGSDLCKECESLGGHDSTHVFLVFKSMVNMVRLGEIRNIDEPSRGPPIIPHPVYLS